MSQNNASDTAYFLQYRVLDELGKGSFGTVRRCFFAMNKADWKNGNAIEAAIKFEDMKKDHANASLMNEYKIYKHLQKWLDENHHDRTGIAEAYCMDRSHKGDQRVLIMELLGPSLEDLFMKKCGSKFSTKTILQIAIQLIDRLETIHDAGIVYRDIKPDNFMIGSKNLDSDESRTIFIADFGLSKFYMVDGQHIDRKTNCGTTGTPRYISLNTHRGITQSRRDDMMALSFLLIYFVKGSLPWQGLAQKAKQRGKQMHHRELLTEILKAKKMQVPELEQDATIPEPFRFFLRDTRKLGFVERPKYDKYKQWFREEARIRRIELDYVFDWNVELKEPDELSMNSSLTMSEGTPYTRDEPDIPHWSGQCSSWDTQGIDYKDLSDCTPRRSDELE